MEKKKILADVIKFKNLQMRHEFGGRGERLNSMTVVFIRKRKDSETEKEGHVNTEAEIRVLQP